MDDPNFTAMLERTGIPSRKSVALAPTILKTSKANDDKTFLIQVWKDAEGKVDQYYLSKLRMSLYN